MSAPAGAGRLSRVRGALVRGVPGWVAGLPVAMAAGMWIGLTVYPGPLEPAESAASRSAVAYRPADSASSSSGAIAPMMAAPSASVSADSARDAGRYSVLIGSDVGADTLPAAPDDVELSDRGGETAEVVPGARAGRSPASEDVVAPTSFPAQRLRRAEALAHPLVVTIRGSGQARFYSAWEAPQARAGLMGEWAMVGRCSRTLHLRYEQALGGTGVLRGVGDAEEGFEEAIGVAVPRQHCRTAEARWRRARVPSADEAGRFTSALGGETPTSVMLYGGTGWVASQHRVARVRIVGRTVVVVWSAQAPDASSVLLLGLWEEEALGVAVRDDGRVSDLWRF